MLDDDPQTFSVISVYSNLIRSRQIMIHNGPGFKELGYILVMSRAFPIKFHNGALEMS